MARPLDVPVGGGARRDHGAAVCRAVSPAPVVPSHRAEAGPPARRPCRTAVAARRHRSDAAPRRDPLRPAGSSSPGVTVPVIVLAMVPALQFPGWQWRSLVLATRRRAVGPAGRSPRRRAVNLRHGRLLTMDTTRLAGHAHRIRVVGVGAVVRPDGRDRHDPRLVVSACAATPGGDVYFEVAAGVVTVLLLGRVIEARVEASGRGIPAARSSTSPPRRSRRRRTPEREARAAATALRAGARFVGPVPASGSPPTAWSSTARRRRPEHAHGRARAGRRDAGDAVTAATIVHGGPPRGARDRVGATPPRADRVASSRTRSSERPGRNGLADRVGRVFVPDRRSPSRSAHAAAWLLTRQLRSSRPSPQPWRGARHRVPVRPRPRDARRGARAVAPDAALSAASSSRVPKCSTAPARTSTRSARQDGTRSRPAGMRLLRVNACRWRAPRCRRGPGRARCRGARWSAGRSTRIRPMPSSAGAEARASEPLAST
jgi:hypothetical protein